MSHVMSILKIAAILLLANAGCSKKEAGGGGGDGGKVASCLSTSISSCREYRGGNLALGTENLAKLCTAVDAKAVFAETACPTDKLIGSCKKPEGKDFFYEGYPIPMADVEKSCASSGGTFAK